MYTCLGFRCGAENLLKHFLICFLDFDITSKPCGQLVYRSMIIKAAWGSASVASLFRISVVSCQSICPRFGLREVIRGAVRPRATWCSNGLALLTYFAQWILGEVRERVVFTTSAFGTFSFLAESGLLETRFDLGAPLVFASVPRR